METREEPILRLEKITKRFPGVLALDSVDLDILPAEVHGLVGENGAGKSTLIKILTGALHQDSGEVYFEGKQLLNMTPRKAIEIGIACIYQELNIIPYMTVTENIFLGQEEFSFRRMQVIDRRRMLEKALELLRNLNLDIDPRMKAGSLGIGRQQMVEICRAIASNAKVIIMDEPTASLTSRETDELLDIVLRLQKRGVSFLFISPRLEEAKKICSMVTVLRDGRKVTTVDMEKTSVDDLVRHMVGRDITEKFPKVPGTIGEEALSVEGLNRKGVLKDISFKLYKGEVLGFAGLVGAGRTELARAIIGADPKDSGVVRVFGKPVTIHSPMDAIRAGIAFLTEDRKEQGLILIQSIAFNVSLVGMTKYTRFGFLKRDMIRSMAEKLVNELRIKTPGILVKAGQLSGGNQQKVVIAKWLSTQAKIFIFDEPTRGIDVGAKVEVYNLINKLVADGAAVIIISSELPEVIGMSDRILVMHEGALAGEFSRAEATQEKIMTAAVGAPADLRKGA